MPKPPEQEQRPRSPSPSIDPVFTWPTPGREDLLFYVEKNGDLPANKEWEFGDAYRGRFEFPDHKLVYVSPQTPDKWSKWFYASDRINQEEYNFEFTGDQLTRSYLVLRDKYYARTQAEANAAIPQVEDEFVRPVVGTADTRFGQFVYTEDALSRTETELDSLYVLVRQVYRPASLVSYQWDETLERTIRITREPVPKGSVVGSGGPGVLVEVEPGNIFHDFKITTEVVWLSGESDINGDPIFPIQLGSLPSDSNYSFPPLLRSASIDAAWAYADSAEAALAYDEAWYFAWDLVEPAPGPYEARILRFLVEDPNDLASSFTIDTPPATQRETIGIARWWAAASNKGNSAFAEAREEVIPSSIHDAITIDLNGVEALSKGLSRTSIPATEGFAAFAAKRSMVIGYEPRRTRFGLYEIHVIELNTTGVYGGTKVPLGVVEGDGGDTGATIPPNTTKPEAPTATISADNTTVSGTTYPNSQVSIVDPDAVIVGRATSDSTGAYSATLTSEFLDAVALVVTVRYNSSTSFPATVTTNDLTPGAPTASVNSAGTTLTGTAQAGSTVNITYSTRQEVTNTVSGTVSSDGDLTVTIESAIIGTYPLLVPVLNGQSASTVAAAIAAAMVADGTVNGSYIPSAAGADLKLKARTAAADDVTLAANITGALGISGSFSSTTTNGIAPTTTTTAAHATTGAYSKTFSPALAVGSAISVTATDAGGTGPATAITVSASPPTLTSATFPDSTSITGVSSAGAVVRAYLNGTEIGNDTADGSGNFDITVSSLIRGEVVTLVAELASDATVKSPAITATAPDLDLEEPTISYSESLGFYGVMPSGATELVHWQTGFPSGATASRVVGFSAERSILLVAVTAGYPSPPIGLVAVRNLPAATDPTCTVSSGLIVINLSSTSVSTATVAHIVALINATPAAAALVTATLGTAAVGTEQYIPHAAMYLLGGSAPVTVTPFANGNFAFTLPTNNGEQYSVVARYPDGDSDEVLVNAPDATPDQPIRFLSIKDERSGLPYPVPTNANPYTYYNSINGVGKSGYREWQLQASDPWVDFYVPWEAGVVVEFSFPGQSLDPRVDIPLAPTSTHGVSYGDIVYRVNSGVLASVSATNSLPPVIQVRATYSDGRALGYTFDRERIKFKVLPSFLGL